eukprot:Amastigsp_a177340_35.p3 type:complete len:105 gc:universal Amastigsp_a177340_35:441-755(+)
MEQARLRHHREDEGQVSRVQEKVGVQGRVRQVLCMAFQVRKGRVKDAQDRHGAQPLGSCSARPVHAAGRMDGVHGGAHARNLARHLDHGPPVCGPDAKRDPGQL